MQRCCSDRTSIVQTEVWSPPFMDKWQIKWSVFPLLPCQQLWPSPCSVTETTEGRPDWLTVHFLAIIGCQGVAVWPVWGHLMKQRDRWSEEWWRNEQLGETNCKNDCDTFGDGRKKCLKRGGGGGRRTNRFKLNIRAELIIVTLNWTLCETVTASPCFTFSAAMFLWGTGKRWTCYFVGNVTPAVLWSFSESRNNNKQPANDWWAWGTLNCSLVGCQTLGYIYLHMEARLCLSSVSGGTTCPEKQPSSTKRPWSSSFSLQSPKSRGCIPPPTEKQIMFWTRSEHHQNIKVRRQTLKPDLILTY